MSLEFAVLDEMTAVVGSSDDVDEVADEVRVTNSPQALHIPGHADLKNVATSTSPASQS
jgi:hypothetical protein